MPAPWKILHVAQPTTAGVAVVVRELVAVGVQQGHHVAVACPSQGDLPGWTAAAGGKWHALNMARSPAPSDLAVALRLRRLMADADIVHLHSSKAGALGRLVALTRGPARIVFVPHGWSWLVGGRLAPAYRALERLLTRVARVTVAVSRDELEAGRRVVGSRADLLLIENGVDTDLFFPRGTPEPGLIVCVGRLTRQKGQDLAIRSLARMRQPARLRLVGDGSEGEVSQIRSLVERLNLGSKVEFSGRDEAIRHLLAAEVVVLPSRWEGLPLAMLEAMACGRPVVASRAAGGQALHGAGVIIDTVAESEFVEQLAAELDRLLVDDDERQRLSMSARNRVENAYSLERVRRDYVDLWERLMKSF